MVEVSWWICIEGLLLLTWFRSRLKNHITFQCRPALESISTSSWAIVFDTLVLWCALSVLNTEKQRSSCYPEFGITNDWQLAVKQNRHRLCFVKQGWGLKVSCITGWLARGNSHEDSFDNLIDPVMDLKKICGRIERSAQALTSTHNE